MKKIVCVAVGFFFMFSLISAQTGKDRFPARPTEQNEMKADKHLEREMQQKQLLAKPERLEENIEKKPEKTRKQVAKQGRKSRSVKSSCRRKN